MAMIMRDPPLAARSSCEAEGLYNGTARARDTAASCNDRRMVLPFPDGSAPGAKEADMSIRPVKRLIKAKPTTEGAGVHLRRAFGFGNTTEFDPFLLLDDFSNDVPEDYLAGFPWHPHRGIETITYVLAGTVDPGGGPGNNNRNSACDVVLMK